MANERESVSQAYFHTPLSNFATTQGVKLRPSELKEGSTLSIPDEPNRIIAHMHMEDHTSLLNTSVRHGVPLFEPIPSVLIFERYKAFLVSEKRLVFRNRDQVR
jgi:hypothetical protein